jgi:hypothetical protein
LLIGGSQRAVFIIAVEEGAFSSLLAESSLDRFTALLNVPQIHFIEKLLTVSVCDVSPSINPVEIGRRLAG